MHLIYSHVDQTTGIYDKLKDLGWGCCIQNGYLFFSEVQLQPELYIEFKTLFHIQW